MTAAAFPQVVQLAQRLRTLTWRDMAKRAWLILLGMLLLKWLLLADLGNGMRPLILIAPLLPFIAKDLSHWPDALERLRAAMADRAWVNMLHACWPPELIGLLRLDATLRHGFMGWLKRRPQPAPPAGLAFTYLERGAYRTGIVREGIERHRTLQASPLDKPNTALMLRPDSRVRLTHLGVERTGLACVFLYVDQPDRLIRAVRSERQQ